MKVKVSKQENPNWIVTIPIILVITILPLILRLKIVELNAQIRPLWTGASTAGDVFSYYKMVFLIICSVALAIGLLLNINYIKKAKLNIYIILLSLYAILTILSTIFSSHASIALYGFIDRFEGMYVILSYILLTISCVIFIHQKREVAAIYKALAISAFIIGLIGVLQHFGFDIFRTELVKKLIVPFGFSDPSLLKFNFKEHAVYSTLQNPNYVGTYMAMLFPVSIMLFTYSKNRKASILYGILSVVVLLSLFGSLSRTGIAAAFISVGLLFIFSHKRIITCGKRVISLALCLIIAFFIADYFVQFDLSEGASQYIANKRTDEATSIAAIENIQLQGDNIKIKSNNSELNIKLATDHLAFLDKDNKPIKTIINGRTYNFEDKTYGQYEVTISETGEVINVKIDNREINFAYTNEKGFMVVKSDGTLADIQYPEKIGFSKNENFASDRGYIWSRSIPLLKNTLFIGNGPDTFVAYFPQNDFIGKLNIYRTINVVIDKPHNMYLQIGVNTGLASLVILLLLFASYIVNCLRIYRKCSFDNILEVYGLCSFLAVVAYLISGLFNDSVISVAPVFWILLGLGIAINRQLETANIMHKTRL